MVVMHHEVALSTCGGDKQMTKKTNFFLSPTISPPIANVPLMVVFDMLLSDLIIFDQSSITIMNHSASRSYPIKSIDE